MLVVSYNPVLLLASTILALMSAFTGLFLTNGLSRLSASARKPVIVQAAIVLGGGIWSTHFVAMLALDLPVAIVYDPAFTLASALIAILLTGTALLLMHFGERSKQRMAAASMVMGLGIVLMHYFGMYGLRGCLPVFGITGYALSTTLAIAMSYGAIRLAYGERTTLSIAKGSALFGLAILVMHFTAMAFTKFVEIADLEPSIPSLSNDGLALIVIFAAFLICGAFLLNTTSIGKQAQPIGPASKADDLIDNAPINTEFAATPPTSAASESVSRPIKLRVPYEHKNQTLFIDLSEVAAIRAEGRYTYIYAHSGKHFCPWSISDAETKLADTRFFRCHRSYLVNLDHIAGFERRKDGGACLFEGLASLSSIPVSRTKMAHLREQLAL